MKATIHYHQVICSKTGIACGHENQYCDDCLFKNNPEYTYTQTEGWQLCPKCNGQGIVSKPPYVAGDVNHWSDTSMSHQCNVCNGQKIISTVNGLPPSFGEK